MRRVKTTTGRDTNCRVSREPTDRAGLSQGDARMRQGLWDDCRVCRVSHGVHGTARRGAHDISSGSEIAPREFQRAASRIAKGADVR